MLIKYCFLCTRELCSIGGLLLGSRGWPGVRHVVQALEGGQ